MSADGDGSHIEAAAEALLRRFVRALTALGVRVLCCQQRIAPALVRLLLSHGVLPLPRLSLRHIAAVRRLSGATPLSHLQPPSAAHLGRIGGVEARVFGGRVYTQLLPPPPPSPRHASAAGRASAGAAPAGAAPAGVAPAGAAPVGAAPATAPRPVVTAVLSAPNRAASEELNAAAACALGTLGAALRQRRPRLVPGAGSLEVLLASHLRCEVAATTFAVTSTASAAAAGAAAAAAAATGGTAAAATSTNVAGDGGSSVAGGAGAAGAGAAGAGVGGVGTCEDSPARAARRLRRSVWELLADALEATVAALAGGGLGGREAVDALRAANEHAAAGVEERAGRLARTFYGWDADAGQPMAVLRVSCVGARRESADGESGGDDSESSSDEDEGAKVPSALRDLRVEETVVAELASEKLDAMFCALEVACACIGVDDIIVDTR